MGSDGRVAARRERRRIAWRSTCLQAVWNYETLQAIGFAWALLPGLERLYPDRDRRAARLTAYLEPINANPYLATIGLGVALRLEQEVARGSAGAAQRLRRLLRTIRSPLGALGDDLVWSAWRPALGALAAAVAMATGSTVGAAGFLIAYNVVVQSIRWRGVRAGYASGAGIARVLQDPFWWRATGVFRWCGAWVGGTVVGLGAWGMVSGEPPIAAVILFIAAFLWLAGLIQRAGLRRLSPSSAFLVAIVLLSLAYRLLAEGGP